MWSRIDLKMRGKVAFQRNYWPAVVVALVMAVVTSGLFAYNSGRGHRRYSYYGRGFMDEYSLLFTIIAAAGAFLGLALVLLGIFVGNVLLIGGSRFFILNQTETPGSGTLAYGFKSGNYGNIVLIMFLRSLFIFLWTLLFVVPGIIKHYEYLMVPYILSENPGMGREEAFLISKKMMMGQKWEVFVLDISYIGWWILTALSFGIVGIFYVGPYRQATFAELYAYNRAMAYQNGYIR